MKIIFHLLDDVIQIRAPASDDLSARDQIWIK